MGRGPGGSHSEPHSADPGASAGATGSHLPPPPGGLVTSVSLFMVETRSGRGRDPPLTGQEQDPAEGPHVGA